MPTLKSLLEKSGAILLPGITDPLTARLAQRAGFHAALVTGAGLANAQFGSADVGLTGLTDVASAVGRISRAVDLPLLVDADTGYGNAIAVMHTIAELEAAGASAIQIEDQSFPKRCGHFDRKGVIEADEMVQKIKAATFARSGPNTLIVARTDARAILGFDRAVDRARRYAAAGADVLFIEAPETNDELEAIPSLLDGIPTMVNMVEGGRTPLRSRKDLESMGYKVVAYANLALRAAAWAVRNAFARLHADGDSNAVVNEILTWDERQELVGLPQVEALEDEFSGLTQLVAAHLDGNGTARRDKRRAKER